MRHHFVRSSAGLRDPNFKNVTLLLHGDGTNGAQNNTFLDSSASSNAITRTGNVAQGSFSPYGDRWSNYFDGTGDYLSAAATTNLNLSSGNWTVECWWYPNANTPQNPIMINYNAGTDGYAHARISCSASPNVFLALSSITGSTWIDTRTGGSWEVGKWYHLAFVRSGSDFRLYVNGTSVLNYSNSSNLFAGNGISEIGRTSSSVSSFFYVNGYVSNARVVKGTAVYTAAFTPPTVPLTAITNTSLLTCQSNCFRDASTNNFAITRNGDVSVQRFSPFGPDTLYRTDRIGGSAYFDGSGDWLQVANRGLKLTAGFFTAECWVYITAYSGSFSALFDDRYWQGGHNGGWLVYINSTGQIVMQASNGNFNNWGGTFITSSNSVIRGQWNHVAIVRGSNDLINIYINGISTTTPVAKKDLNLNSGSGQSAWESRIGVNASDIIYGGSYNYLFTGIISDLRVINGKCLYTANFTPPTEPLTAVPETTFLGRFANASIVDNAMMSNLETVGNAQIDTTTKKYGTGSMEFDGTGDYLTVPNNPAFSFGTGDFTIECWIYIAGNSAQDGSTSRTANIFSGYATSGAVSRGYAFQIEGNSSTTGTGLSFSINNSGSQSSIWATTSISQNTWHHVAVCRSGTTTRLFLNGSSVASGTLSNQNVNSDYPIMIGRLGYPSYLQELNGYIDDLRITKGVARYIANFTPPTAPFPDF